MRPRTECPQRHRATNHCQIQLLVSELYGAQWRRRRRGCREDCIFSGGYHKTGSSERQNAPTPPMSAPGGLARRFWSDASANHTSVASLREYPPPNRMARHRTLRRATASVGEDAAHSAHSAGLFLTKKQRPAYAVLILPPVVFRTFRVAKRMSLNCVSASAGTSWKCRRFGRRVGKI